jgi:hypothetical protein
LCKKIACHSLNTGKPNLTRWNSWRIHQLKLHIYHCTHDLAEYNKNWSRTTHWSCIQKRIC